MTPPAALRRALAAGSIAWAAALPLATFAASRPQPAIGYLFALAVYLVGGAVCHQIDARSFHVWGRQMPVCARCAGIYLGAAIAALPALFGACVGRTDRGPASRGPWAHRSRVVLALAALPAAATLVFEWSTGIAPGNGIRAASGLVLGAAIASVVLYEVN